MSLLPPRNLPANINNTADVVICQRIPRSYGQVKMILVTTLASILDGDSDNIALPADTLIGRWTGIRENDLAATEWSRGALTHPKGADSNSKRAIRAIHAAGS
jgi:hypothetical protein